MRDRLVALLLAGVLVAAVVYLPGEQREGTAVAIDGDSLRVGGREIRLYGIDAPELRQPCQRRDGTKWSCGRAAATLLKRLAAAGPVTCRGRDVDRYGRLVAKCRSGDTDLGSEMVRLGLALALRSRSSLYVAEEGAAESARRGLWSGRFTAPWQWRETGRGGITR